MIKRFFFFLFFLFFTPVLFAKQPCLQYGVIPSVNIKEIEPHYVNWKKYLENEIERCIDLNFANSYSDIINNFSNDTVDFAFVGPFSYVLTKKVSKVTPLVTGVSKDGTATYKSLLISTPQIAKLLNISEPLKGEDGMKIFKQKLENYKKIWVFSFTDESSTSGYAVPYYYMKKVDLNPEEYFKKITFSGSHDSTILVVKNNIIPIAVTAELVYNHLLDSQEITPQTNAILWKSDDIPKSPIIINDNLPQDLKEKIQKALINMPNEYLPKIGKTFKYQITNEDNYKIIENIHQYLH